MVQQIIKARKMSPLKGVLMIAGIAVSIVLVTWVEQAIRMSTGSSLGAIAGWLIILVEVLALLRVVGVKYRYSVDGERFTVERVYGDHARVLHDIPVKDIIALGGKDDIFKQYGNAQSFDRAVARKNAPEKALAYRVKNVERPKLLVFQPNKKMERAILEAMAGQGGAE